MMLDATQKSLVGFESFCRIPLNILESRLTRIPIELDSTEESCQSIFNIDGVRQIY